MASYKIPEVQNIKFVVFCVLTALLHMCYNWPVVYFSLLSVFLKTAEKAEVCRKFITPCFLLYPIVCVYVCGVKVLFTFSYHMTIFCIMILLENIPLCLSIILK